MVQHQKLAGRDSGHPESIFFRWRNAVFYLLVLFVGSTPLLWRVAFLGISGQLPGLYTFDEGMIMSAVAVVILFIVYGLLPQRMYYPASVNALGLLACSWSFGIMAGIIFGIIARSSGWADASGKAQVATLFGAIGGCFLAVLAQTYADYVQDEHCEDRDPHQWLRNLGQWAAWAGIVVGAFFLLLVIAASTNQ